MVNDSGTFGRAKDSRKLVATKLGIGTADMLYIMSDGSCWEDWDGFDRTGQIVKELSDFQ